MKITELVSGLRYMMTQEQKEIVDLLKQQKIISRPDLSERHQRLAEQMTGMGLIDRIYNEKDETISYKLFNK